MKRNIILVLLVLSITVALSALDAANTPQASEITAPSVLPTSLEKHYPPHTPAPVYLIEMIGLSTPFSGMMTDLMEGDFPNASANYEDFKARYAKVAAMVPEWTEAFPMQPVEDLGAALKEGNQAAIMKAGETIGQACHSCHLRTMVPAHHKFHWGDFGAITTTDPITGQDASFTQFMHMIESDLSGIGNDLKQGQPENALKHAQGLSARYATLKETCGVCHDSDREYFVDDAIMKMIADLPATLNASTPNPDAMGKLLTGIGQESCHKCHLVHIPAAYSAHIR